MKSKNIIVLQEVYGHLTEIYESALITIADIEPFLKKSIDNLKANKETETIGENKSAIPKRSYILNYYTKKESERVIHFALECLTDLINGKGSVLSMWALDPSIFSLLIKHSGLLNKVSYLLFVFELVRATYCLLTG